MQPAFSYNADNAIIEPHVLQDFKKGIVVPRPDFEAWLEKYDWTFHQLARQEFPQPYATLDEFQLACVCADPYLWCTMFLRDPEDPDHDEPYNFWDYEIESLRFEGGTVHKCAAETGKTREIVAWGLWKAFTVDNGSGLIGAAQQTHLEEIIEAMHDQMIWNPDLGRSLKRWKKAPHHAFYFSNSFKIDFRPSGFDGEAYRGVHARTFAIKDEAAKDKNKRQWSEFWRAIKPGCIPKIYSVPDGDRSCEFFKLTQRATRFKGSRGPGVKGSSEPLESSNPRILEPSTSRLTNQSKEEDTLESFDHLAKHIKTLKFTLFQWAKPIMPDPFWSAERRRFYVEQYGGEDAPEYKHNVLGEDGDPEHTVFPWHQFKYCVKDVPEYRALKIIVDAGNNEVIATGYKGTMKSGERRAESGEKRHSEKDSPSAFDPVSQRDQLIDTIYMKSTFFDFDEAGESEFTRLIKSFFVTVPGLKRAGGDFGYSGDVTEIIVKSIIGEKERLVARLHLKHVTYDQQCQALNALDDVYGPMESLFWGTDFGNAGSAVAHDLQGLQIYAHKNYDDRLKGFMFESTTDNINEAGEAIIDGKTGKPAKITLKELATDIIVKKMQRQELEYPPDPDIILYYTNHTVASGGKHRIYKKKDDHLIDADRVQILAKLLAAETEDLFA